VGLLLDEAIEKHQKQTQAITKGDKWPKP
jgi:hypothetical protein